jgi:hypothetical protein
MVSATDWSLDGSLLAVIRRTGGPFPSEIPSRHATEGLAVLENGPSDPLP